MGVQGLNTNDFLSPLLLAADPFTLPIDGSFATPAATQLLNPNRTAMVIDEFRLGCDSASQTRSAPNNVYDFSTLYADIRLGSIPLTNGPIPVRAFMPVYTLAYTDSIFPTVTGDKQLTWHLTRPLYVPPNVQISCTFYRRLPTGWVIADANMPFVFSIAGRSLPSGIQIPNRIYVPWASAMAIRTSTAVPYTSPSSAISNPHDQDLHMAYLCGFQQSNYSGAPQVIGSVIPTPITVQATFSNGKILMRDPMPFLSLFPPDRPIVRLSGLLQPKQFATFTLDLPNPITGYTNMIFTTIGLVGYRSIQTPQGAQP